MPSSRSGDDQPPALSAAEQAALDRTKGALFGSRRGEATAQAQRDLQQAEEESSSALLASESAVLSALDSAMHPDGSGHDDGDGDDDGLDVTTADIDFDGVDTDLARFQQDDLVKEALAQGVDLRNYSRQIEAELAVYEGKCVEDYVSNADELSTLHSQLRSCDGILGTMESMLAKFQLDLSAISGEIHSLQEKSYGMNVKLANYRSAEKELHSYIAATYIPADLCNAVLEGDMNEALVAALQELDAKLLALRRQAAQARARGEPLPPAARDMAPLGEKLKLKSVARIRAFLLERFHSLKKPKTNIQIKQKLLLRFAPFYAFLLNHADERSGGGGGGGGGSAGHSHSGSRSDLHAAYGTGNTGSTGGPSTPSGGSGGSSLGSGAPDICGEVRREYHETLSAIYHAKFKKYLSEMAKLQAEPLVRRGDLLGASSDGDAASAPAGAAAGGMGGMLSGLWGGKKASAAIDHVFRLNGREEVLNAPTTGGPGSASGGEGAAGDFDLIIPHLAGSAAGQKLPFERLFRAAQHLLMDTATAEYDFIVEFFGERMARDMDRAGVHEDALAAEKEKERDEAEKAASGAAGAPGPMNAAAAALASSSSRLSYDPSSSGERGRSNLLPASRDKDLFKLVFGRTLTLFLEHLDTYLSGCHDALGVLLLIRVVCQHNIAMQFRRVHCLDHMFDRMNMTLWPKFKTIFDANVESVINLKAPSQIKDPRKSHILCTRYADFASGILLLNEGYNDPILTANLARLSGEVNKFLLRSAATALAARPDLRLVYLINAHGAILRVLGGRAPAGASESAGFWAAQAAAQVAAYVEAELRAKFGGVILMLERLEAAASARQRAAGGGAGSAASAAAPPSDAELRAAVSQFNSGYAAGIKSLHEGVHSNFALEGRDGAGVGAGGSAAAANDAAGLASSRQIFMQLLSQLLLYHQRFDALSPHKLAPKTEITAAIKKYTQQ